MSRRAPANALVAGLLLATAGCGSQQLAPQRNVLLITLDTVRADRIGCYGYEHARTPNLDALARRGARFERAYAPVPYTLPSHATLLTGIHPAGHGVHVNFQGSIHPDAATLAEVLRREGYRTAAFVATGVLDRRFGLARGFDVYDDLGHRPLKASEQVERPGDEVTRAALPWLLERARAPFFAWVHYYDAHDPYEPPEGFRDFEEPYDGEIAFVDHQVGELTAALERIGVIEETYVVVVADHGEAFGEHGEIGHGLLVYEPTMRVPMIVAGPDPIRAGLAIDDPVGLVDVHATVLALLGIRARGNQDGRSLLPALSGAPVEERPLPIESEHALRSFGWAPLHGLVSGPWKYVRAPEPELYELASDPAEATNLATQRGDVLAPLAESLSRMQAATTRRRAGDVHLDATAREVLAQLGYVEGAEPGGETDIEGLKDPKAMVHVWVEFARARALARAEHHDEALAAVLPLLEQSPESGEVWVLRGTAELALGRAQEAIGSFEESLRLSPENTERLRLLGDALDAAGRGGEALATYRRALLLDPEDGQSHGRLGVHHARAGELELALEHLDRHVELDPTSPNAHTNLANVLFAKGRFETGIEHLDGALRLDPACAPAHRALYAVLARQGRRPEAIHSLREAIAALPQERFFRARLAWELATWEGSGAAAQEEAERLARDCLAGAADDPSVLDVLAAALARRGKFPEAIEFASAALRGAQERGPPSLADAVRARLELYRAGRAFLE